MPDIKALEIYYWTAVLGSFSAAAHRCNITQSAVSQRIAALEKEFNTTLILRDRKTVGLTAKGSRLLNYSKQFVKLSVEMNRDMSENEGNVTKINLGCIETIANTWLNDFLIEMKETNSSVLFDLHISTSGRLRADLVAGRVDIAFLLGSNNNSNFIETPLGEMNLSWVASPKLDAESSITTLEDLFRHTIITYPRGTMPHTFVESLSAQTRGTTNRISGNASLVSIIKMLCSGTGVGLIPEKIASAEIKTGALRTIEIDLALPSLKFFAAHRDFESSELCNIATAVAERISMTWHERNRT
jgi:DNA-binding transcriptional LysR family regulator